eukprot:5212711-Prymnesium_polylepis.2
MALERKKQAARQTNRDDAAHEDEALAAAKAKAEEAAAALAEAEAEAAAAEAAVSAAEALEAGAQRVTAAVAEPETEAAAVDEEAERNEEASSIAASPGPPPTRTLRASPSDEVGSGASRPSTRLRTRMQHPTGHVLFNVDALVRVRVRLAAARRAAGHADDVRPRRAQPAPRLIDRGAGRDRQEAGRARRGAQRHAQGQGGGGMLAPSASSTAQVQHHAHTAHSPHAASAQAPLVRESCAPSPCGSSSFVGAA